MKSRVMTGAEVAHVLRRSGGLCVVRATAHGPTPATRAVLGPAFGGGAAACDACLVAMRLVQAPATPSVQPTLLPPAGGAA